jgi:hypothetical protein
MDTKSVEDWTLHPATRNSDNGIYGMSGVGLTL